MSSVIDTTEEIEAQSSSFVRGYVEWTQHLAKKGLLTVESYSPATAALVNSSLKQVEKYTPSQVKDVVDYSVDGLDGYVESAGNFVGTVLVQTKDFPLLLQQLREKLSPAQFSELLTQVRTEAGSRLESLSKFLPSDKLQDKIVKIRVQEIVDSVMATEFAGAVKNRVESVKETVSNVGNSVKEKVDAVKDGKVSINDIYSTSMGLSQTTLEYCTGVVSNLIPLEETITRINTLFESLLEQAKNNTVLENVKSKVPWETIETFNGRLAPLWAAAEVLKGYVSQNLAIYTNNVSSRFARFCPRLTHLVSETSVAELPFEIYKISLGSGDENKNALAQDAKSLMWALIDISFIFWAENEMAQKEGLNAHGQAAENETDSADAKQSTQEPNEKEKAARIEMKTAELTKAMQELSAFKGLSMP